MIKDKIENAGLYYGLSESIKTGFEWLKNNDLVNIECKRYVIDGDRVWANVQEYETKDDAKYETHNKYIDIQYMIRGKEQVGVVSKSECVTCVDYDSEKDLEFLDSNVEDFYVPLNQGEFLLFYPTDAHKPSISCNNEKMFVKKVVVKVAAD